MKSGDIFIGTQALVSAIVVVNAQIGRLSLLMGYGVSLSST